MGSFFCYFLAVFICRQAHEHCKCLTDIRPITARLLKYEAGFT